MPDVTEIRLPGIGVRHEFTTSSGERLGVLSHRSGRQEIVLYDRDDPDTCTAVLHLSPDDTRTLGELLGAAHLSEGLASVVQVEGLALDWITIPAGSSAVGTTIGEGQYRSRTGVSIVAVVRAGTTVASPGPDHRFEAEDVAVAVGTADGLRQLRDVLGG
ncbi:MAG: cation:proton antiporter regulatory subunit [Acidimicrobiales bacterium]